MTGVNVIMYSKYTYERDTNTDTSTSITICSQLPASAYDIRPRCLLTNIRGCVRSPPTTQFGFQANGRGATATWCATAERLMQHVSAFEDAAGQQPKDPALFSVACEHIPTHPIRHVGCVGLARSGVNLITRIVQSLAPLGRTMQSGVSRLDRMRSARCV